MKILVFPYIDIDNDLKDELFERSILTRKELCEITGIPERTIAYSINSLKNKNIIKRIGSDKKATGTCKIKYCTESCTESCTHANLIN